MIAVVPGERIFIFSGLGTEQPLFSSPGIFLVVLGQKALIIDFAWFGFKKILIFSGPGTENIDC